MKKIITIIVPLLVLSAVSIPYFIGIKTENYITDYFTSEEILKINETGYKLTLKEYDRGFFNSTSTVELTFSSYVLPTFEGKPVVFQSEIKHGPWIFDHGIFSAVSIDSKIINESLPSWLSENVSDNFYHSKVNISITGDIDGTDTLSPVNIRLINEDDENLNTQIDFKGLNFYYQSNTNSILEQLDLQADIGELLIAQSNQKQTIINPFTLYSKFKDSKYVDYFTDSIVIQSITPDSNSIISVNGFKQRVDFLDLYNYPPIYYTDISTDNISVNINDKESIISNILFNFGFKETDGDDIETLLKIKANFDLVAFDEVQNLGSIPLNTNGEFDYLDFSVKILGFEKESIQDFGSKITQIMNNKQFQNFPLNQNDLADINLNDPLAIQKMQMQMLGEGFQPIVDSILNSDITGEVDLNLTNKDKGVFLDLDLKEHFEEYVSSLKNLDKTFQFSMLEGSVGKLIIDESFISENGLEQFMGVIAGSFFEFDENKKQFISNALVENNQVLINNQRIF